MKNKLLPFLIILSSFIFILRLFWVQLIDINDVKLSNKNSVEKVYNFPERGYVFDRNDRLIVGNELFYDLMIIPAELKPIDTLEFCKILKIAKTTLIDKINKAKKYSRVKPSVFLSQISKTDYAIIQEKLWKYKGFSVRKKSNRNYLLNSASNILGYISEVNDYEVKDNSYYESGELIGRQGIEKSYEKKLRGLKGVSYFEKDNFNRTTGSYKEGIYDTLLKPAKNINLTIDSNLQIYGDSLMVNKFGSIVAIEPESGEILSLINAPSFDPNLLIGRERSTNYLKLKNDTIGKPLFDRGLQGMYPPGSTFKLINGLIALQEDVITPSTKILCNAGHFYSNKRFMKCHCKPGTYNDLNKAIYNSCNTYFATIYKKTIEKYSSSKQGVDNWKNHVNSFGLGNYLGYDHPLGQPGLIPDSKYYDKWYPNNRWRAATTISNGIGQGEILTTPIQLGNIAASIANRGWFITPHFVKKISNDSIKLKYREKKYSSIDSIHFEKIVQGMYDVIEKGTAQNSKIRGIEIVGKTGTAENFIKIDDVRKQLTDHSIFIGFAPKENPKIAIAVFIENGYWGTRWAAPIASLMMEKYLNKKVERKYLEKYIFNGNLMNEYLKPYTKSNFSINE
ncbi:penicillin-binding protein 2 [Flavobacteriaceae bacterium]|mgnify:FL=1|jgi:penicillin-binding protein 2|nr:penicillin-binding protein 2 [Flavobacteriaceae bacterium]